MLATIAKSRIAAAETTRVPRPRKPRSGRRPRNAGGLQARSWHGSQFILPPVVQLM